MRKMATIRRIDAVHPIVGADTIEAAVVGGWTCVVKKGEYRAGDLAVYCEIDSWIPTEIAPFLSKGKEPREFEGIRGERLRTVKLRGQLSQGLLLPWTVGGEGMDVSEQLGIVKYDVPINAQLAGIARGGFPSQIPKTDQERVQNLTEEIRAGQGLVFEVTEKLEGSSMTVYRIGGTFGVCSRNLDLLRDENNAFWKAAIDDDIEAKTKGLAGDYAIQGELIGPGIQGNIYKLKKPEFRVFDVYHITSGQYVEPHARRAFVDGMGLLHVPVMANTHVLCQNVEELIKMADAKSVMGDIVGPWREGIVFKQVGGGMTFKVISNKYLLGQN